MSEHTATIRWYRNTRSFAYEDYDRRHMWRFDSGAEVAASAAPAFRGNPECIDPEEALVASLSSCHMLTFLAIASKKRLLIDRYEDNASGVLEKTPEGMLAITRVTLRPRIVFAGDKQPTAEEISRMHEKSHEACFIANSVKTEITISPDASS